MDDNYTKTEKIEKEDLNAIQLINRAGRLLCLPQVAIAKAAIFYHKCIKRNKDHNFRGKEFFLSSACCFLGTKSEESLKPYRDILMVYDRLWKKSLKLDEKDQNIVFEFQDEARFVRWKKILFKFEYQALLTLGHILNYEQSYKFLLSYLHALNLDDLQTKIFQRAWNYLNDSLFSPLCIDFRPEVLACSAIYLVSLEFNYPLPEEPLSWHEYFDVKYEEIEKCADSILSLYFIPAAMFDIGDNVHKEHDYIKNQHAKNVEEIKKQLENIKKRIKQTNTTRIDVVNKDDFNKQNLNPSIRNNKRSEVSIQRKRQSRHNKRHHHNRNNSRESKQLSPSSKHSKNSRNKNKLDGIHRRGGKPRSRFDDKEKLRKDSSIKEKLRKDPSIKEKLRKDPPIKEKLRKDLSIKAKLRKDPSIKEKLRKDSPIKVKLRKDPPIKEKLRKDPSIKEKLRKDPPIKEKLRKDPPIKEKLRKDYSLKTKPLNKNRVKRTVKKDLITSTDRQKIIKRTKLSEKDDIVTKLLNKIVLKSTNGEIEPQRQKEKKSMTKIKINDIDNGGIDSQKKLLYSDIPAQRKVNGVRLAEELKKRLEVEKTRGKRRL